MTEAIAAEYQLVIDTAKASHEDGSNARRTLARLRRELRRIRPRDFFPPPEREKAESAVEELGKALEAAR
jgi:hypothetical protein